MRVAWPNREAATRRLCAAERGSQTAPGTCSSSPGRPRLSLRCAKPPRRGFTTSGALPSWYSITWGI